MVGMTEIVKAEDLANRAVPPAVVTIGVFDGVHVGHQRVLARLREEKEKAAAQVSVLITFDRHPLSVIRPEAAPRLLTTLEEKISLLALLHIDIIVIERFTIRTAELDYRTFIAERLLDLYSMKHLVVGYDFHLGKGREGNRELLSREGKEHGFGVTVVPPVVISGRAVSSTRIRNSISHRKLRRAARLLTRPYFFDADIVRGEGIGRTLDFPTANARVSQADKLLPPRGVYAVRVEKGGRYYPGMMNVGFAPTIRGDRDKRMEVHLFDYRGKLYDQRLRVHCLEFIREEKKFRDRNELQAQLLQDREKVTGILEKNY
ncbi:MAG: bifunctional riboflavin kinase/FAD synthetase [Candidatus Krumholzibacteriota bacterium]|nr:bifunctional riboflavin kinase/FAD synthetase [Candidatus Krumholzibacteriota bacterium]